MATTIFGSGTLAIGATASPTDMYECAVGNFVVTASPNLIPIPATLCIGPGNASQPSSWSCSITYMQDWGETLSLSQLLFDADGTELFFEFTPNDTTVPSCAGSFSAVAGDYGGEGQGLWTNTSDLPMQDKPTITPQA